MKSKKSPQEILLEKMLNVHAFIERSGDCTMRRLCLAFGVRSSSLRHSLNLLYDSGHLDKREGKRHNQGQEPGVWFATGIEKAIVAPARKASIPYKARSDAPPDATIKRKFTSAKQIGIPRDALVAAFFGAGPAAHA